ncbi:exonuclease SbcC [Deinococcus reticulitermitis]|uniref:Exonuclease SbcC n=1 Tax=Deinococcus reticulitermitis TaxID=856736 RepID=A0A1H6XEU7_9DEIO|nr:SMC family ATPase [Deinococcus reticulitermitis]SEJ26646.1 exonuclease SbcC [Deinococcus reticulitermitis]
MKPLHLSLQGFTAFRQPTQLDFSDLELFALVGPTGSGKSSLLDAMTFALYGETARLGSTGLDALIAQGERGLSVSLTFEAGGDTYRASRTRGRRQAENEVRLDRLDPDGEWTGLNTGSQRDIGKRIEEAVGLDFDTFTRCVMLPQGQFAALLHGKARQRQELLGELMGLSHVQQMQAVSADRVKEFKHQSASLGSVLLSEYAGVSPEAAAELRRAREATDAETERLVQTREHLQAQLLRLREQEKVWRSREDTARRLQLQESRAASVREGAERARQARRVAGALPLLDAEGRARIAAERQAHDLAAAQEAERRAAAAAGEAAAALQRAEQNEARLPALEERAQALREAEADAARLRRAGGTPQLTHADPLPWNEDAFELARERVEKLKKLRQERVQIDAEKAALEADRGLQRTETEELARTREEQTRLEREGKQARQDAEQTRQALDAARLEAGLAAYHAHLHVGKPCPLCEQPVQDVPPPPAVDLARLEAAAQAAQVTLDALRDRYPRVKARAEVLSESVHKREQSLQDWAGQLAQRERDLTQLEANVPGDPQSDLGRLLASLAARVRQAGANPAQARQTTLAEIQAIRRGVQAAAATLSRAQGDLAGAQATAQAAGRSHRERQADWHAAQDALTSALNALGLSAETARAAGMPEGEIAALEDAARKHEAEVGQLRAALAELDRQLGAAPFDPAELTQAARDLTASDAALTTARERAGSLAEQERSLLRRLTRKAEIEAQAAEAGRALDTWQTLNNALKVNEFQQFLLAEVEAQLLTRAGMLLFDISDGRYRLSLEKGEYVVQDLWNAGEVRAVKTLSGGETFLASLALAIALSDYLAGTKVLGALFLDEGFGTLDPQALEAVATALENLRTQGRMVGIVTHVESLSERLPSRLLVSKSMAGSQVMRVDG